MKNPKLRFAVCRLSGRVTVKENVCIVERSPKPRSFSPKHIKADTNVRISAKGVTKNAFSLLPKNIRNSIVISMNTLKTIITKQAQAAKNTLPELRRLNTDTKNQALHAMADILIKHSEEILTANAQDLTDLPHTRPNANQALKNRLILTKEKITAIAASLRAIAALPDPVGEILGLKTRPNGLRIG